MTEDPQLTPAELFNITGKRQAAAQLRHLRRMGIKAERSDNPERPVCVLRAWLGARAGDTAAEAVQSRGKPLQAWEEHGATS